MGSENGKTKTIVFQVFLSPPLVLDFGLNIKDDGLNYVIKPIFKDFTNKGLITFEFSEIIKVPNEEQKLTFIQRIESLTDVIYTPGEVWEGK